MPSNLLIYCMYTWNKLRGKDLSLQFLLWRKNIGKKGHANYYTFITSKNPFGTYAVAIDPTFGSETKIRC